MKHHELKLEQEYYQAKRKGLKNWELRKNDRDFQIGDTVTFWETINGKKTGRYSEYYEIVYLCIGGKYGLDKDHCIFSHSNEL